MEDEGLSVRLVRCPKCENLLPELPEYSVYQCGGCGAVLRGKQSTPTNGKRPLETPNNENDTRLESSNKEKIVLDSNSRVERKSDEFEVGRRKGRTPQVKVPNLTACSSSKKEKREIFTDSDQNRRRRLDFDQTNYGVSNEFQEVKNRFGPIRSRPIRRNGSLFEKGKFGNLPYSNEGPSSSHLSTFNSFGDGDLNELSRVQDLENDRVALLKKLDELRTQLTRSCNVTDNPITRLNGSYLLPHQPPPIYQPPHQHLHHQYPPPMYHDPFLGYNQEPILHRPSCSCSQCYSMNWQPIPPKIRPFSSFNSQPEPLTYGPRQMPRHHANSLDLGNGGIGGRYPRRRVIFSHEGEHISHPLLGGAPFISCCNCFELLKIPKKLKFSESNGNKTIKCAVCSALISLRLEDNKMIASISSPISEQKVNEQESNRSSVDYDKCGYNFQLTDTDPNLSSIGAEKSVGQSPDSLTESQNDELSKSQNDDLSKSQRTDQERMIVDQSTIKKSLKDALVATEIDVSSTDYSNCDVSREDDELKSKKMGSESFFAGLIKKRLKDFSRSSNGVEKSRSDVFVNGQLLTDRKVRKAEKLAGPILPGDYWYDSLAGFWGVMNQPCLGIIPPFIEEFDHPMPKNCAAGNTGVFVNGRELNQKDLDLLAGRGLPTTKDRSYIIDISGKVVDEDTGEELDCLGKLAPTVEKVKHGFGMKVPKAVSK
ncbi:uncharacterized protein [Rutidosis leptorrhynchoides]|uniref:uncharacterized protein n=1 Tax=Rutidosis leptorrhynchoides TaxID=125765 RepID=UPI003A99E57B